MVDFLLKQLHDWICRDFKKKQPLNKMKKKRQQKNKTCSDGFDLTFKSIISCWESRRCCVVRLSLSEYIMFTCSSHTHPEILLFLLLLLMRLLVLTAQRAQSDRRNDVMILCFHRQNNFNFKKNRSIQSRIMCMKAPDLF